VKGEESRLKGGKIKFERWAEERLKVGGRKVKRVRKEDWKGWKEEKHWNTYIRIRGKS
jgi:hypothetical protein